ncbi:MAG: SMI1/KNR4 family protein [Deltaproteobacteria bacterium]|nr:SMI1/KNR4 family protein [Deltaproteobacteria bacterium]
MISLQTIRQKLEQLGKLDPQKQRFGASKHQHQLNAVAKESALADFEKRHGVKLPTDYRQYLLEVADGGAGPFYGLYSLEEGTEQAKGFAGKLDDPLSRPFPLDNAATRAFLEHWRTCIENGDDDEIVYPEVPEPCPGLVFLCDYGCGWSYALVVNGEQAGTVWFVGEYLSPIHRDGKQLSFLEWIDGWLDDDLAALNPSQSEPPKIKDVTILNYDGHQVTALPPAVLDSPRLKKLVLSRSQLKEFPRPILELRELRTLDLSMSPLTELPKELSRLTELRKLRFNYNHWTSLPDTLDQLTKLEELSIYYSYDVTELPEVVGRLGNLKKLFASYCSGLWRLPDNFGALSKLENLTLNDTALAKLPESFGELGALRVLRLGHTKLKTLAENFSGLRSLEALDLGNELLDLEQVISVLAKLPRLQSLTLSLRERFPASLKELRGVRRLTLQQNYDLLHKGMQRLPIPEEVGLLTGLEELDLTNANQANALPESIGDLVNLKVLGLHSTAIRTVPESIRKLKKLEVIRGNLSQDPKGAFGILPEVKAQLQAWFPEAKIQIW